MSEFRVTGTELVSKAEELEQLNASFKNQVEELDAQELSLSGMWEGEAKEAFHKTFTSDKIQMNNFYNAIVNYAVTLKNAAAAYNNAEGKNIQIINERSYK